MDTKACTKCGEIKPLSEYYKDRSKLDGLTPRCKLCKNEYHKAHRNDILVKQKRYKKLNREKMIDYSRKYYQGNKEKAKAYEEGRKDVVKEWRQENKEKLQEYQKQYSQNNRVKLNAIKASYRASKLQATPSWLDSRQKSLIEKFYEFRNNISGVVNREYHVDHIVPLQGENVCGLHVPWNLQVIPAKDNISKKNTYNDW